jgi:hypothetical protein
MKVHTTNYKNAFIEVAEDCPATSGEMPPVKGDTKTVANIQFDILYEHPYEFTSDDVIFQTYAIRQGLKKSELKAAREQFFSKGQACMRTSPLTKRYGWGVHNDAEGKIAIYPMESKEYQKFAKDKKLEHTKAMRTSKK